MFFQPSPVPTENKITNEFAIVVGVSVTVVLLLITAVTLIPAVLCVRRRTRRKNLLTTATNVAYQSRGGHKTNHNLPLPSSGQFITAAGEAPNLPLPIPPTSTARFSTSTVTLPHYASVDEAIVGALNTPNNEYPLLANAVVLQNETESLNDISLRENISYDAGTEEEECDYVIVTNGYGTTQRRVFLSPN